MSHVDPRPTRPGAWVAALCAFLLYAAPAFAQNATAPVRVIPQTPCIYDDVRLVFTICTCNSHSLSAARVSEVDARVDVATNPEIVCVRCAPDTVGVDFGRLALGHHRLGAMIVHHIVAGPDSGQVRTENYAVEFDVANDCSPPPEPLPFLNQVLVGSKCDTCPQEACPGDSIPVRLKGTFTDPCYAVVELSASPNPSASPLPQPDVVRIVYEHDSCTPCPAVLTPWQGQLPIGPLPLGDYRLPVEAYLRERCGAGDSLVFLGRTSFPFKVSPCESTWACYSAGFQKRLDTACEAVVGPDRPGVATFGAFSSAVVGGVQGKLIFDRPGLRVLGLEPVIAGTILKWDAYEWGATFVVVMPAGYEPRLPDEPLFRVRVGLVPGTTLHEIVRLMPEELLVSDADGHAMPMCNYSHLRLTDPSARFCPEGGCDMNADGRADVRDLVVMVNCLQHPDDRCAGATPPDCNEDGQRNVDDVLCCARQILGGPRPDSTGSVPAPEVTLQFAAPVPTADGVDVSVRLVARQRIGAMRLVFTYPDAAFADASIELAETAPNWLVLHEGGGGALTLGAIRLSPDQQITEEVNPSLPFTVHLTRRAGAGTTGALSYVSGDFSDPNGAVLVTNAAPLSMPLGVGAAFAVGAAHPNPFGRETRFSVSLPQNADHLDVSIYDLAGRKVATLWNGPSVAGTRELRWRRTRDDGTIVPSGMYFYRATSEGHSLGGKLLVLTRD